MNTMWFSKENLVREGVDFEDINLTCKLADRENGMEIMEPIWDGFIRGEYDVSEMFARWAFDECLLEIEENK